LAAIHEGGRTTLQADPDFQVAPASHNLQSRTKADDSKEPHKRPQKRSSLMPEIHANFIIY
jgi:hypothetical protein